MKLSICLLMLPGTVYGALAQAPTPTLQELLLTDVLAVRYGDVAMGDYDLDRDLDILLTGAKGGPSSPNPSTVLYRMLGDTTLIIEIDGVPVEFEAIHVDVEARASFPALWRSSAEWGDYDNDGDLDLALMGLTAQGEPMTRIFQLRLGSRIFTPRVHLDNEVHSGDLAWVDIDHDGDLDLIVCGFLEDGTPNTSVYANPLDSGGTDFVEVSSPLVNVGNCSLDLGDYDIDGDMDLLISGTTVNGATLTRIYASDGFGGYNRLLFPLEDYMFATAAWGDQDADGYLDIAVTGAHFSPLLLEGDMQLYRYDTANSEFALSTQRIRGAFQGDPTPGKYYGDISWGDLDNDGYNDLVVTGAVSSLSDDATQIYLSEFGTGLVKSTPDNYDGGYTGAAVMVDYDLDRDLDMVVIGETPNLPEDGTRIRLLRNNISVGRFAPVRPEVASVSVRDRSATFSWLPGEDRQTPMATLTYNLRVGTTPGGVEIVSPMAHPVDGRRHITARGNAGSSREWTIRNLAPGTYYWSVQTLDGTYSGSIFMPEQSFTIQ